MKLNELCETAKLYLTVGDEIPFFRIQFDCILGKPKKHSSNQVPCAVVGCKSDLGDEKRMITKYEGQKFAVKHGAKYDFFTFLPFPK